MKEAIEEAATVKIKVRHVYSLIERCCLEKSLKQIFLKLIVGIYLAFIHRF